MIKDIPLTKLIPSPRNVRRSTDEQADLRLKADIEARGLLQNLVVAPAKKPRGAFTVDAGGRRLRALNALVDDGKLDPAHEVPCLVIGGGAIAQEASLAENFHRLAMNPADECLAFQQLIEQGADAEGIARRFGLTVRFVEGRLRLAGLAPVVFEALGAGEITLDLAKAYGATPDRERQAFVFEQVSRSYMASHPDSIRRMMTQATVSASDRRARFVGEETYVKAGGRIERDLFSDEDSARWLDIALLESLATQKMERSPRRRPALQASDSCGRRWRAGSATTRCAVYNDCSLRRRRSRVRRASRSRRWRPRRKSIAAWTEENQLAADDWLFPSRSKKGADLSTRQYARLVDRWVGLLGLDPAAYGTHSMRRTKVSLLYKKTGNLRACQLLLGHTKLESTVRYLGVEVDDALELSEALDL